VFGNKHCVSSCSNFIPAPADQSVEVIAVGSEGAHAGCPIYVGFGQKRYSSEKKDDKDFFLYSLMQPSRQGFLSSPKRRTTQPAIQWITKALSHGLKRPRCEANHKPRTITEGNKYGDIPLEPPCAFKARFSSNHVKIYR
jgi:hypothetical protein